MFGAFSKLFKKSEPESAPAHPIAVPTQPRAGKPLSKDGTTFRAAVPKPLPGRPGQADAVTLSYSAIIKLIPQELWGKLAPAGVAGYNYTISRKSVLEQIPHGSVKVSFGELRRGAPAGVFINTPAEDTRLVDLPLSEILAQLHPDTFARRPDQSRVEVSKDVPDLFGAKGERLAPLRVMEKKEVTGNTSTFTRQNVSTPGGTRPPIATAPPVAAPGAPPLPFNIPPITASPAPAAPAAPPAPLRLPVNPSAGAAPAAPKPIPFPVPKLPTAAPQAVRPAPLSRPVAPGAAAGPVAIPSSMASFAGSFFFIGLDEVAEQWPDGVRQELAQLKIPDAKVALPPVEICEGLKRGRIQYPWRTIRSWIQPTPIYAAPSPHDELVLELPLRTLTPLFLDFIRANPVNRQAADAENITEFFRKAEQATGTSPELLQPLFEVPEPVKAPPAAPAPAPAPAPAAPVAPPTAPAGFTPAAAVPSPAPSAAVALAAAADAPTEPTIENGLLCLPMMLIAANAPDPVRLDIAQFGLAGTRVEIPLASVEPGLKTGRVDFSWRELCSWLNPPSKPAQVSMNGETRVPLPLGVIAPVFLKNRSGGPGRKKSSVAESIPDLFSAAGKPLPTAPAAVAEPEAPVSSPPPAPAAASRPAPASRPAAVESTPSAAAASPAAVPAAPAPRKAPTNLSELFGEPDKKSWTPNEIVQRTTHLPNVAGSLIALQDGLLVASNMPNSLRTETIAAFVPQIFGRLNQYSKELQLGETTAVSFTVKVGPMQVYNAGIIYFAVLGKPGTVLPHADLQLIAAELSRHTK